MKDEPLKSYLKNRLGEHTHPVGDELWTSISKDIPTKKRPIAWYIMGGALGAAAVLAAILFLLPHTVQIDTIPMPADLLIAKSEIETPLPEMVEIVEPTAKPMLAIANPRKPIVQKAVIEQERIIEQDVVEEPECEIREVEKENKEEEENLLDNVEKADNLGMKREPKPYERINYEKPKDKKNRALSVQLAINQIAGNTLNGQFFGDAGNMGDAGNGNNDNGNNDDDNNNNPNGTRGLTQATHIGQSRAFKTPSWDDAEYDFPISFVFAVRKNLNHYLALESGLMYTYLHVSQRRADASIKQHYLGIPLKLVATFYNQKRITLYGNVGGAAEWQIAGKMKAQSFSTQLHTSHTQWSASGALGLGIKLSRQFSIFAEPGVIYYFDDKNGIPSIRKERPLNFNLQAGVRFNLK